MYPFNVQRLVGTPDIVTTRLNDERQTVRSNREKHCLYVAEKRFFLEMESS